MAENVVLDTSVVVAHLRNRIDLFSATVTAEFLFLPVVALGELYKGAEKSNRPPQQHSLIEALVEKFELLSPDSATARQYARLAAKLEQLGQPIPENDLWIAASALEGNLPLATRDAHFARVPGLTVLRW